MEEARLIAEIVKWVLSVAVALISGDSGPEPKRLADILPPKLRADVEHARQRLLLAAELEADLEVDDAD